MFNKKLKQENERLNKIIDNLNSEIINAEMRFDFKKVNAFSIERHARNNVPCTIIGYKEDNEIREWELYCSMDTHNRLVREFDKSRGIVDVGS